MRRLTALLALVFGAACDDGGGGGTGGAPDPAPGDACDTIIELGERASGSLSADRLQVACGPGADRLDAVLRFVPSVTGSWLFDAQTTAGDPLAISLREQCDAPASQRACGDGRLTADLDADVPVFLVVEATDAEGAADFTVEARPTPPPSLTSAAVHFNPTYATVGVSVVGEAPARPVETVELTLLDGIDDPLLTEPLILRFDRADQQGADFTAVAGRRLAGLEGVARAVVRVFDSDQVASEPMTVDVAPPGIAGETCDPRRAIDACPGDTLCTPAGCAAVGAACPDEWIVEALDGPGPWSVMGTTSGALPHGRGSCGGGAGSVVYRFEAPQDGQYLIDVRADGHPDPLLFVRSACGVGDVAAELGCNDDALPGDLARSNIVTTLAAGDAVFIFVDGYAVEQSTGGAYRLTVKAVTPPTIDDGEAFVNLAADAVGARIGGADPDADLSYAWMLLLDADGGVIESPFEDAFDLGFTRLTQQDGRYTAQAAIAFLEPVEALADLAMVGLWTVDDAGLESDLAILEVQPAPALESGAECDALAAFGACPPGEACGRLGAVNSAPYCAAPEPTCPADWAVVDLHAEPDWRHAGDTTGAPNHGDLATCTGGGPDRVYRFEAPSGARYVFEVTDAAPGADSVLFARSHCAFSQAEYELACNDDQSAEDFLSHLELDLAAGEAVYLFVGGYGAQTLGRFTLEAR